MNNAPTAPAAYPTSVTVADGYEIRVYAQTASRDYTATVVPGTYPIEYTTVRYTPADLDAPHTDRGAYYARVALSIVSPERVESTVEYGGVALASKVVAASTGVHTLSMYAYEVQGKETRGALVLNY